MDNVSVGDIFDNPTVRPGDKTVLEAANKSTQKLRKFAKFAPTNHSTSKQSRAPLLGELAVPTLQNTEGIRHSSFNDTTDTNPAIPSGRSIAHFDFAQNNVAFISFDIETGG